MRRKLLHILPLSLPPPAFFLLHVNTDAQLVVKQKDQETPSKTSQTQTSQWCFFCVFYIDESRKNKKMLNVNKAKKEGKEGGRERERKWKEEGEKRLSQ